MRVIAGSPATITGQIADQNGEPVSVEEASAVVVDSGGTEAVSVAATIVDGRPTIGLTSEQTSAIDCLTVTFTSSAGVDVVGVDVVGGTYATIAQIRQDPAVTVARYPDVRVLEVIADTTAEFERETGASWVKRFERFSIASSGGPIALPRPFVSEVRRATCTTSTGVVVDIATILQTSGIVRAPYIPGTVTIDVVHGADDLPLDLRRAFVTRVRSLLLGDNSGIPSRASTFSAVEGGGTFALLTPGRGGSRTGIPDVDAILEAHDQRVGGIG